MYIYIYIYIFFFLSFRIKFYIALWLAQLTIEVVGPRFLVLLESTKTKTRKRILYPLSCGHSFFWFFSVWGYIMFSICTVLLMIFRFTVRFFSRFGWLIMHVTQTRHMILVQSAWVLDGSSVLYIYFIFFLFLSWFNVNYLPSFQYM